MPGPRPELLVRGMPADSGVHGQTPDIRKDLGIGDEEEHEGEQEDAEDEGEDAFDEAAESLASGGSMLMSPRTFGGEHREGSRPPLQVTRRIFVTPSYVRHVR